MLQFEDALDQFFTRFNDEQAIAKSKRSELMSSMLLDMLTEVVLPEKD